MQTKYLARLQFEAGGPAVEGEWTRDSTAHDRYTEWVGLYSKNPSVVVRLLEQTGGEERVLRTGTGTGAVHCRDARRLTQLIPAALHGEGLIREALARMLPDDRLPAAPAVGGYWTRTNDVEIDIVGADRAPLPRSCFVGSIKWLEESPFDRHDLAALHRHRAALTGEPVPVVAVSRSGVDCPGLDAAYGPGDLLAAWPL